MIDAEPSRDMTSDRKLAAAVEVIGQISTDNVKGQKAKAEVHSRPLEHSVRDTDLNLGDVGDKRPRLFRKNHEPIYSSIQEVTSQPLQRISTGFDEPPAKTPPFPEASTDFRGSPSYETVSIYHDICIHGYAS